MLSTAIELEGHCYSRCGNPTTSVRAWRRFMLTTAQVQSTGDKMGIKYMTIAKRS